MNVRTRYLSFKFRARTCAEFTSSAKFPGNQPCAPSVMRSPWYQPRFLKKVCLKDVIGAKLLEWDNLPSAILRKTLMTSPTSNATSSGCNALYLCLTMTCGQSHCSYSFSSGFSEQGGSVACSHRSLSDSDEQDRI